MTLAGDSYKILHLQRAQETREATLQATTRLHVRLRASAWLALLASSFDREPAAAGGSSACTGEVTPATLPQPQRSRTPSEQRLSSRV